MEPPITTEPCRKGHPPVHPAPNNANIRLLVGLAVLGIAFLIAVMFQCWHWTREHIDRTAEQQARLAIEFDGVLRDYIAKHVRPEMVKRLQPGEFVLEVMSSSFVARSIFEGVRAKFPDYVLRFPSTNPRNPLNRATQEEEAIIRYFEDHPEAEFWAGTLELDGEPHIARATPRRTQADCLRCHGRPEDAPAALREQYGTTAGFGCSVGDVSIDLAAIPVAASYAAARAMIWRHMLTAFGLCAAFLGAIGLIIRMDVRQRQRSEQALRQAKEESERINQQLERSIERANQMAMRAEAASVAKSAFLANMSHEIRTPMTAICGFADVLAEECPRRCEYGQTQHAEHVKIISRNAGHMLQLINDILDLSKIESGKFEVESVPCSPASVLSQVQSLLQVRAKERNLALKVAYDGPVPQTIRSDPGRLRQILINLVGNAIKFAEKGQVRVVVRLDRSSSGGPFLQFDVIDTGIGMTPEQTERIFQPFVQADGSTTRKYGGTGLGLAISKHLAQRLGGDIAVRSTSGQGSTFSLTIATGPLEGVAMFDGCLPASPSREVRHSDAPPQGERPVIRVLLAEDGIDNRRLIGFLLRKAGIEPALAENGQQAVEMALAARDSGRPFDVILMDMQMPVLDGYDATRQLRRKGYDRPIIALTAHAMKNDRVKCLQAGCDDYLSKPLDRQLLLEKIVALTGLASVA